MPCSQRKARLLLKEGKAKIIGYKPFTIQLLQATGETTQEVHLGVDTGAKYIGIAAKSVGKFLVWTTNLHPFWMGILVSRRISYD